MRTPQVNRRHPEIFNRLGDLGVFDPRDDAIAFPRLQKLGNAFGQTASMCKMLQRPCERT